jgi:soluble lytic murein transglycosylase-like protein
VDWTNPCGGKQWRTLADGSIEVAGEGVPLYDPNGHAFLALANSWQNWQSEARSASSSRGVPLSWILGIISAETGNWAGDPAVQADCGPWSSRCHNPCCAGPMQVMVTPYPNYKTYGGYENAEDMKDPAKAIDAGAAMLASMAEGSRVQGELPALAATYNSGGVYCDGSNEWGMRSDPGYVRRVLTFNNTALAYLDLGPRTGMMVMGLSLAAGGLYAAWRVLEGKPLWRSRA